MQRAGLRLLFLPPLGLAAFLRAPFLFETPRFWAEEGSNYFQSAVTRSLPDALLHLEAAPRNPYLHPLPHLATVVAAHGLPLELSPWVTTLTWVLVFLAGELVALFGRAELLDPGPVRALACAAPLLAVGSSENWVNTLGAHFFCDVALLLLLLEAPRVVGARRTASIAAFAVFALLSPTSFVLVPAALWLAQGTGKRPYRGHVLALGGAVLLAAVIHFAGFPSGIRTFPDRVTTSHLFLSKFLVWPLLGHGAADAYGVWAAGLSRSAFLQVSTLGAAGLVALVFGFWLHSRRDATTRALLATWLSAAGAYVALGLDVGRDHLPAFNGGRYAFLPDILLMLLLGHQLVVRESSRPALRRLAFGLPLAAAILVGVSEYRYPEEVDGWLRGRSWASEVRHFRETPSYDHLHIAPPEWVVVVPTGAQ